MVGRTEPRKAAGTGQASGHSSLSAGVLLSSAVSLGPPVPVYTLRWLADQAPERTDQHFLLWRSGLRNRSGGLPPVENPLRYAPASIPSADRRLYTAPLKGEAMPKY